MGIGGIGIGPLLVILLIIILLFGTKKLKGIGSDLGSAVKGFKKSISDDSEKAGEKQAETVDGLKKETLASEKPETAEKTTEK